MGNSRTVRLASEYVPSLLRHVRPFAFRPTPKKGLPLRVEQALTLKKRNVRRKAMTWQNWLCMSLGSGLGQHSKNCLAIAHSRSHTAFAAFWHPMKKHGRRALGDVDFPWLTSAEHHPLAWWSSVPACDGTRMSELIVIGESCPQCTTTLAPSANFCSHCGVPAAAASHQTPWLTPNVQRPVTRSYQQPISGSPWSQALNHRGIVITLLLCIGPLGLPALWFSHKFSQRTKILLTIAYFLVTILLPIFVTWYWVEVSLRPLLDSFGS